MKKEDINDGVYLIKSNDEKPKFKKEFEEIVDNSNFKQEQKNTLKSIYDETDSYNGFKILVEIVGENPFLIIKTIKNYDTNEDITERFKESNIYDNFWLFTKNFEWSKVN